MARHAESFGFGEIRTPIFEETELYTRTSGASSDIVRKEMYTFLDRGGRSMTLRPEGTAGVARAYLENGLASAPQPVKLWYLGPLFRYDRPQAGRLRQHTQFGVEVFGAASPLADLEVVLVAHDLLARLGLERVVFRLNSIGCPACRPAYRERLVAYFGAAGDRLCPDCRERVGHNPLRVFDCKSEDCRALLDGAPLTVESLCPECEAHHLRVGEGLAALGVPREDDPRLVRGLDYYTRTVFEAVYQPPEGAAGAQHVLCGGGRYDGLVEELGGPPTPGVGFGLGVDRLVATLEREGLAVPPAGEPEGPPVFVATTGGPSEVEGLALARRLRGAGFRVVTDLLGRSLKAQFRAADRAGARVVLVGEDELARRVAAVRDLDSGVQTEVPVDRVVEVLAEWRRR
jgi:histidyl-tRNA synthetase